MSANSILNQQVDNLALVMQLLSTNPNPKDIAAAHEEARRQMQLTEEEEARLSELREFSKKYESLVNDIEVRESVLLAEKNAHATEVDKFHTFSVVETKRLNDLATNLGVTQSQQQATDAKHAEDIKKISAERVETDRRSVEINERIRQAETANNQNREINKAEAARLAEWERELKDKVQRIRQQAANF